jgi:NADPH-dependent 2,4-dienoyl-CoA reductase/sulfur reductase-like enzyme
VRDSSPLRVTQPPHIVSERARDGLQRGRIERRNVADHVLVLGGGVGGMSAAHELAERGFSVTVIEDRDVPGGKARSIFVPDSGRGGRQDLPAEHGFRFFPGF